MTARLSKGMGVWTFWAAAMMFFWQEPYSKLGTKVVVDEVVYLILVLDR